MAASAVWRPSRAQVLPADSSAAWHGHLWFLPDGTGLHAPAGILVTEAQTGRLCCHLCGKWFAALGAHVRAHGYTARTYREVMGLAPARSLAVSGRPGPQQATGGAHRRAVAPLRAAGVTVIVPAPQDAAGGVWVRSLLRITGTA